MNNNDKLIKCDVLYDRLDKYYNNTDLEYCFNYIMLLDCFIDDISDNMESIKNRDDSLYYMDGLSFDLTDLSGIGQPTFILWAEIFDILKEYYDLPMLEICDYYAIMELYDITNRITFKGYSFDDLIDKYERDMLNIAFKLFEMDLKAFNDFIIRFYKKHSNNKIIDNIPFIIPFKDKYLLRYDLNDTMFILYDKKEIKKELLYKIQQLNSNDIELYYLCLKKAMNKAYITIRDLYGL